MTIWS